MAETSENGAETGEKGKKKLRILLRTFKCPLVQVARDDFGHCKDTD